ncbi:MAG TPA: hypothetical protein PK781_00545 [Terrimesophilobacter sp.]|nr:hypothetical protein [Terrimesophilobacter sp.]HRP98931.1 hypothetical protein [Terrimesophilobacter sp.]
MSRYARTANPIVLTTTIAVTLLTGCSPQPTTEPTETTPRTDSNSEQQPCIVGEWMLDVATYAADSENYLLGLAVPVEGFEMSGNGIISFTADGLVAVDIDLTSTGELVARDTRVPFTTPGRYQASGDWGVGSGDTINLSNWSDDIADTPDPLTPETPGAPAISFTDVPSVNATCTEHELHIALPGAPLDTHWFR